VPAARSMKLAIRMRQATVYMVSICSRRDGIRRRLRAATGFL
jgi:hypothetical protein